MNRKLKIIFEVIDNVGKKYRGTKNYLKENMKEKWEWELVTVEEVIFFVIFV